MITNQEKIENIISLFKNIIIPDSGSIGLDINQLHGFLGEAITYSNLQSIDKSYIPAPPNTPDYDGVSEKYGRVSSKYSTISSKDSRIFLNNNLNFEHLFITKKIDIKESFYLVPRSALTTDVKQKKDKIYLTKGSKGKLALAATQRNLKLLEKYLAPQN